MSGTVSMQRYSRVEVYSPKWKFTTDYAIPLCFIYVIGQLRSLILRPIVLIDEGVIGEIIALIEWRF